MFYVPLNQTTAYADTMLQSLELQSHRMYGLSLVTKLPPGAFEPQIVRILANIDPNLTINSVRTMEEQVALSFDQDRAVSSLAALFGVVALLLAAVGLYGVTAYTVAQRTNEIGIRMALGADRPGVVGYVLRGALTRVVIGLALGLPLAVLAGKLIATQLYGVAFFDPPALGSATISLAIAALIAAMIPALSAASFLHCWRCVATESRRRSLWDNQCTLSILGVRIPDDINEQQHPPMRERIGTPSRRKRRHICQE